MINSIVTAWERGRKPFASVYWQPLRPATKWFTDRFNNIEGRFRFAFESQSKASSYTMLVVWIWVGPIQALSINIIWAIAVAVFYARALENGRKDLMVGPKEEGWTNGLVSNLVVWHFNGLKETGFCKLYRWVKDRSETNPWLHLARKPIVWLGTVLFGVTPGYHLLSQEYSAKPALWLNTLGRIPNALFKIVLLETTRWLGLWAFLEDKIPGLDLPI